MATQRSGRGSRGKRLLPWFGTAALLVYLGFTTDVDTLLNSLAEVSIPGVLIVALVGTLVTFLTDTWCVSLTFTKFVCPVRWREAAPIKATSYFLNILNYNVALVGMAFYLQQSRRASFWRALGGLLFLNLVDIVALGVLLALGLLVNWGDDGLNSSTRYIAWTLVAGGGLGYTVLIVSCRFKVKIPFVSRLLRMELLAPLADVDALTTVKFVGLRAFFLLQYLAAQYAFLLLFGVDVPLLKMLVYMPLLTFVQIIPVSISGLGTTQIVMRHFYSPYVTVDTAHPGGVIDAFSTTAIFGFILFRVLVAYLFLGEFGRDVIEKVRGISPTKEESEEPSGCDPGPNLPRRG